MRFDIPTANHQRGLREIRSAFSSSKDSEADVEVISNRCLQVSGIHCDRIEDIGECIETRTQVDYMGGLLNSCNILGRAYTRFAEGSIFQSASQDEDYFFWDYFMAASGEAVGIGSVFDINLDELLGPLPQNPDVTSSDELNIFDKPIEVPISFVCRSSSSFEQNDDDESLSQVRKRRRAELNEWEKLLLFRYKPSPKEDLQTAFRKTISSDARSFKPHPDAPAEQAQKVMPIAEQILATRVWWKDIKRKAPRYLALSGREQGEFYDEIDSSVIQKGQEVEMLQRILQAVNKRRFFVSSKGYLGLAPATAQAGDLICVLFGGKEPFILRELDPSLDNQVVVDETRAYSFVGPAYVHGLMHGEAMDLLANGEMESQKFRLY
jgi:hypothetical protein